MTSIVISGVNINFPHKPYDVQTRYMEKLIECLQKGENGILESPTGTGKTLSLLCASLAWLESRKAMHQAFLVQNSSISGMPADLDKSLKSNLWSQLEGAAGAWDNSRFSLPKIIYSSRTHSQLSQAVQELKRTGYNHMSSVVVGSRDQLCLHPEVSKLTHNVAKLHACRAKVNSRSCPFYQNVDIKLSTEKDYREISVLDIEDLVTLGKKHTCCPYYAARNLKSRADIIFTPYNYLIDPKSRKAHGIELQGNIIIFDEAHNIENVCEESMSFQLRSADLALCISEITQAIQHVKEFDSVECSFEGTPPDFTLSDLSILKVMFCELEEQLDKAVVGIPVQGCAKPGNFMYEILSKVDLTEQKKDVVLDLLDKVAVFLTTLNTTPWMSKGSGLQKFTEMLKILFIRTSSNLQSHFSEKFKVYLQLEQPKSQNQTDVWTVSHSNKAQGWLLNCWCFCPGMSMQDIVDQGIHCMILTSGTLSPLKSFASELGQSFPIQLENPHIISPHQAFVAVVTNGPDGTLLNSSYQNRTNPKYINSLGRTILNFSRLVPDGLLVFFPSYSVLKSNANHWEESGVWQNLSGVKSVFMEPQRKDAFQESIEQYYKQISEAGSRGSLLLSVCRGKVSEGLDFADKNARGVIITGLPFPPSQDPRVKLKMSYLDDKAQKNNLSGQEWYLLQASRAVNQAVGRVIRHAKDFGAVLLCDSRFAEKRIYSQLSMWVRGRIRTFNNFGPALRELSCFFKSLDQKVFHSGQHSPIVSGSQNSFHVQNRPSNCIKTSIKQPVVELHEEKETKEQIAQGYMETPLLVKDPIKEGGNCTNSKRKFSIFDALDEYENSSACSSSSLNPDQNVHCVQGGALNSKAPENSFTVMKRKRINVKLKDINGRAEEIEADANPRTSVKDSFRDVWKKNLIEVKSLLRASGTYPLFIAAVMEYKKEKNIAKFSQVMKKVCKEAPSKERIIQIVACLVPNYAREEFMVAFKEDACTLTLEKGEVNCDGMEDGTPPCAQPQQVTSVLNVRTLPISQ